MGTTTVRSPWNTTGKAPMRGWSPGSRSSPSNAARSDGGHIAGHVGKGGSQPRLFILAGQDQERETRCLKHFVEAFGDGDTGSRSAIKFNRR
jgi:hypothetical protein